MPGPGVAGGFQRRQIASAAGALTLRAPESLSFQGTLHAHAGAGDTPAPGGTATYQLTRQRGFRSGLELARDFPDRAAHAAGHPRSAGVTLGHNGIGVVDVGLLRASGLDALSLEAGDRIEFYGGADLSLGRSLQIAAPLIGVSGDSVRLAAPSFRSARCWTPRPLRPHSRFPAPGAWSVGDLVELTGRTALSGLASATFEARASYACAASRMQARAPVSSASRVISRCARR